MTAEREQELIDYLRVLGKWKWRILAGSFAAALIVFVMTSMAPRTYEASVTLLVTDSKIPRPEGGEAPRAGVLPPETFEAIIRSQALALDTIRQFGLDQAPWTLTPAGFLAHHLSVKMLRGTGLITLTATFGDPRLAADVANFVARRALELNARLNQTDTVSAKEYIQRQRDDARKTMDAQQAALVDFKRSASLESLRAEQSILLEAKQKLAQLYSDYTIRIRGYQTDVVELRKALTKHEQLLTLTRSIFEDPSMLAVAQERGAADLKALSSIQLKSQEVNRVHQNIQDRLIANETALAASESQRQDIERKIRDNGNAVIAVGGRITDADARLAVVTRNYTLSASAYELFAKKFDEASLSVAARITELKIVDPALIPLTPVSRRVVQKTAMAAAVSLTTLILLAFFLDYLKTARTRSAQLG
jgi:uncharacterized protein involved in exopolysaccharide biosynthesis